MGLVREQDLFMGDLARLVEWVRSRGLVVTGGELWRTKDQQQIYFRVGKSRTMASRHCDRLAVDLNIFKVRPEDGLPVLTYEKADLQEVGDYWESLDEKNSWGGNWAGFLDTSHFERRRM